MRSSASKEVGRGPREKRRKRRGRKGRKGETEGGEEGDRRRASSDLPPSERREEASFQLRDRLEKIFWLEPFKPQFFGQSVRYLTLFYRKEISRERELWRKKHKRKWGRSKRSRPTLLERFLIETEKDGEREELSHASDFRQEISTLDGRARSYA